MFLRNFTSTEKLFPCTPSRFDGALLIKFAKIPLTQRVSNGSTPKLAQHTKS